MAVNPDLQFTTLEDLWEEDSLRDEPSGACRCHCGRFAHLISPPRKTIWGTDEWEVKCGVHGVVWVS